ncbi:hypothetical protein P9B03_02125 [Metasolibacillus meyeri]|uniref:Type II secretion system protein GspF domain-containing protein n=1 Tax=Metasolibacillus meyeri TaxID=1071052 RepID=A0AAW9NNG2_9BACL|nr:hypothetical protein [Metasolibacillus meyeri]MEC1177268.1 hypothetical protein [Metasolibacillus meyeri]
MKQLVKEARHLFYGWELALYFIFWFAVNGQLFYYLSNNSKLSLFVGFMGAVFFFFVYTIQTRKLVTHQKHLSELLNYVINVVFYLQTGENILYALKATREHMHPDIQKKIDQSIEHLEQKAELQTSQFEEFDFPILNQFHQNLAISYEYGGNKEDLFGQVQQNMVFELRKRDELYRKRQGFAMNVYALIGMVLLIPIMLKMNGDSLWTIFLETGFASQAMLFILYMGILWTLYLVQKKNMDISVRN